MMSGTLLAAIMLSVTSISFAGILTGPTQEEEHQFYSGMGVWKSLDGEGGPYRVVIEKTKLTDTEFEIKESYKSAEEEPKEFIYTVKKQTHNFLEIFQDGQKIGQGYCFHELASSAKVCHMEYETPEKKCEKTLRFFQEAPQLKRVGSCSYPEGLFIWKDALTKI